MFFANLTALEFLGLFAAAAAATVALYLLIRTRKRVVVSTLRFWEDAKKRAREQRRRRIDEPWSLLLQLLAIALLLLAIAQPRFGTPETSGSDHVLLLDTSSWMQVEGQRAEARRLALGWLRGLPKQDRVMVVRAEALATPVTRFESSYGVVEAAIRGARAGATALDLGPAFELARQAMRLHARRAGEVVYVGPGLGGAAAELRLPDRLRVLETATPAANVGLTRVVLRQTGEANLFEATATVRNYGARTRAVAMTAGVGGALVSNQLVQAAGSGETAATFRFRATAAGWLEVRLDGRDAVGSDDRATLEIPKPEKLRVMVYSADGAALRPLLESDGRVEARYAGVGQYDPGVDADLVVMDGFEPARMPTKPALVMSAGGSAAAVTGWNATHPVASGIRSQDLRVTGAKVLGVEKGDVVVARSAAGALITARGSEPRQVRLGFHPVKGGLRFELATPLLFANIFHWVAPAVFVRQEVMAATPGPVSLELDEVVGVDKVRVIDAEGAALPFTLDGKSLRFFTAERGTVRVITPRAETVFALTLPGLGAEKWRAPEGAARGVGAAVGGGTMPTDVWQALALAGLALIALEWWLFRRKPHSNVSLGLKVACVVVGILSLFQPDFSVNETKLAVAVAVDTSASVTGADLARATEVVRGIEDARGRHLVRVLPFAGSIRMPDAREMASGWKMMGTTGEAGRATNLESAIREAATSMPAGLVPRIALITDGRENAGSAARAAYQARALGIPIDTFLLGGRTAPQLRIEQVKLPAVAFTGERFPLVLEVSSPRRAGAELEIAAEGKVLGRTEVTLDAGVNELSVRAAIATAGAIDLVLTLKSAELGEVRFEQAVSVRRPRLLYVTQDAAGMDEHLRKTLEAAQFDTVAGVSLGEAKLDDYQVILLNNFDLDGMGAGKKAEVERFVQQGGGLMVIGGERNVYMEKKQPWLDALDRTLPATVAPPRSPEGAALILIVDKSSSMEGRKMELARLAAIGVVENLKPIDQLGVLIFDNSHQWSVPLRRAEDRTMIKRLIAGITPDGGTQIAPALAEAYKRMLPAVGVYKHIVLLTDGISEEGDSLSLAKEAAGNRITISTVGLGQDVNRAYLERIAQFAKGKAHFLTDPSGLEQILLKDVQEHLGSTTVEKSIQVKVAHAAEILSGVQMESAPALKGYVRFQAKPTAESILTVDAPSAGEKDDPLLTRWQYGLGRAAVFASDAKTRWAEAWVSWAGYDKFWANVLRDLLPHAQAGAAALSYDGATGLLTADYRQTEAGGLVEKAPALFVMGPEGFQRAMDVERLGPDHWRAKAALGGRRGLFRVRPLEESRAFPETGLYLPEPELTVYGSNEVLLKQVSAYTGGRFNGGVKDVFDAAGRSIPAVLRLWPGLLAAALILNLLEVAWRRLALKG